MSFTNLSFVMVCVIFAISSFQVLLLPRIKSLLFHLSATGCKVFSPNDVVQLGTYSCTVNSYCGMGLRWPEEGLNFSGGVPEGKYLVINSVSIQPTDPGAGVMVGTIIQKKTERPELYDTDSLGGSKRMGRGNEFFPGVIINSENDLMV